MHDLATVTVNGQPQGTWWHPPFARDVTSAIRSGENTLEIMVANTWHNRLVGDEQEPVDFEWGADRGGNGRMMKGYPEWFLRNQPRPSSGRKGFVVWYHHRPDSPLEPAGLVGPVRLIVGAESPVALSLARNLTAEEGGDFEANVVKDSLHRTHLARVEEKCSHAGGGRDASALFNGTTRNGEGGDDTLDDGHTFRGYAAGDWLVLHLTQPCDLREVRTFAGHHDGRASQGYDVLVAYAAEPGRFVKIGSGAKTAQGASEVRVPLKANRVTAIRLEFKNGPSGFNVYREINLVGTASKP